MIKKLDQGVKNKITNDFKRSNTISTNRWIRGINACRQFSIFKHLITEKKSLETIGKNNTNKKSDDEGMIETQNENLQEKSKTYKKSEGNFSKIQEIKTAGTNICDSVEPQPKTDTKRPEIIITDLKSDTTDGSLDKKIDIIDSEKQDDTEFSKPPLPAFSTLRHPQHNEAQTENKPENLQVKSKTYKKSERNLSKIQEVKKPGATICDSVEPQPKIEVKRQEKIITDFKTDTTDGSLNNKIDVIHSEKLDSSDLSKPPVPASTTLTSFLKNMKTFSQKSILTDKSLRSDIPLPTQVTVETTIKRQQVLKMKESYSGVLKNVDSTTAVYNFRADGSPKPEKINIYELAMKKLKKSATVANQGKIILTLADLADGKPVKRGSTVDQSDCQLQKRPRSEPGKPTTSSAGFKNYPNQPKLVIKKSKERLEARKERVSLSFNQIPSNKPTKGNVSCTKINVKISAEISIDRPGFRPIDRPGFSVQAGLKRPSTESFGSTTIKKVKSEKSKDCLVGFEKLMTSPGIHVNLKPMSRRFQLLEPPK